MQDLYEYLQEKEVSQQEISHKLIKILKGYNCQSKISLEAYLLEELDNIQYSSPNEFIASLAKGALLGCAVAIILMHTKLDGIVRNQIPDFNFNFIKTQLIPNK